MSKISTAFLFVGPSGVGPFHSPDWRVCWGANLVEGGSRGPYWLPLPPFDDQRNVSYLFIDSYDPELVSQSLILLLATVFGTENLIGLLVESHNITEVAEDDFAFAPFWELAPDVLSRCVDDLRGRIKIGFVQLDDLGVFDAQVLDNLARFGLEVEPFAPVPRSAIVERL